MGNGKPQSIVTRGFTLVEMTVAIALSALMMVAMIGVLDGIGKRAQLVERFDTVTWPRGLERLLRRDLGAAKSIWIAEGTLWIRTDVPGYHSEAKGLRDIAYRCVELASEHSALQRVDGSHGDLIALGVKALMVNRVDAEGERHEFPEEPGPVPRRVCVMLWDNPNQAPIYIRELLVP